MTSLSVTRIVAASVLTTLFGVSAALSQEYRLDQLSKPVSMAAIPGTDNGRRVGMSVTFGNSWLHYRAFKGRFELSYVGQFDKSKLPPPARQIYSRGMEGAAIYQVKIANDFRNKSKGGDVLALPNGAPSFVTIQRGKYVDGKKAIWVCLLSSLSLEQYYDTQMGHERCDAFR